MEGTINGGQKGKERKEMGAREEEGYGGDCVCERRARGEDKIDGSGRKIGRMVGTMKGEKGRREEMEAGEGDGEWRGL